jgi:predicted Zn-dependent protease
VTTRREVLGALGAASGGALLWALGCGGARPLAPRAPQVSGEVRTWLHDAVARLAAAHPFVHALAVSRRRTTCARDVLGTGTAHQRADGVLLTVRGRDGAWRDHAIAELSRDAVDAAARALDAPAQPRAIDFGPAPATPAEPPPVDDRDLAQRLDHLLDNLLGADAALAPRLIYTAAAIDIDDAIVWSVSPGRDLEQRLVRIRQTAVRAASSGNRAVVRAADRAWSGGLDDQLLTPDELTAAGESALEVLTPGRFDDGERSVVLDPSVAAIVLDAAARGLFTADAARRPEVARRLAGSSSAGAIPDAGRGGPTAPADASRRPTGGDAGARPFASPLLTLIDDPTVAGAHGGFAFDDEGEPAAPLTLLDAGRIAARLATRADGASSAGRGRRPGHLGPLTAAPSHLRLVPGTSDLRQLYGDGFILEGGLDAVLDPAGDRIRVACARARELVAGKTTGRLYADVELVASLPALLSAVDAVASSPSTFAPPGPLWRSISTPALRTRAFVRAVRSRA